MRPADLRNRTLILSHDPPKPATVTLPTGRSVTSYEPGIRWRVIRYTRATITFTCARSGYTFTEPWPDIANLLETGHLTPDDPRPI